MIQQGAISPVKASTWSLRGRADPGRGVARRRQRLYSCTVSLFVRMVIAFGHRHRLMAGEVVDLLYRYAKVQQPRDKGMAEAGSVTR